MCEYSGKLIAWLDQELTGDEMIQVERHVRDCSECRRQADAYREVGRTFGAYCDTVAAMETKAGRRMSRWVPELSTAAAVVFAALLLAFFLHTRVKQPAPLAVRPAVKMAPPAVIPEPVLETTPTAKRTVPRRPEPKPVQVQSKNVNWVPSEPAIEIVVPAESMFPPGAIPEGFAFTADLSIAPDGSAQQIRLRPQLVGYERRIQP
jgi:anti-sigma factor RsiW